MYFYFHFTGLPGLRKFPIFGKFDFDFGLYFAIFCWYLTIFRTHAFIMVNLAHYGKFGFSHLVTLILSWGYSLLFWHLSIGKMLFLVITKCLFFIHLILIDWLINSPFNFLVLTFQRNFESRRIMNELLFLFKHELSFQPWGSFWERI